MKYLIVIMSFFLMGVSIETSIIPMKFVKTTLISMQTNDKCDSICIDKGFHIGKVESDKEIYRYMGLDLYIKIKQSFLYHKWGLGLTVFDKQGERIQVPWDFHISLQSGINFNKFNIFLGIHHWSNARGFAKKLNLEKYWPDKNSGFDALTLGVSYEW